MRKITTIIAILCLAFLSIPIMAENPKTSNDRNDINVLMKKKRPPKSNYNSRIPAASKVLDCTISDGTITFHPSFWGDGMSVRIISENGVEWTGFVSESNASMTFDGQIGLYNIECKLVNGSIYFGQFYMQTYI